MLLVYTRTSEFGDTKRWINEVYMLSLTKQTTHKP